MTLAELEGIMADVAALNGMTLDEYIESIAQHLSVKPDLVKLHPKHAYAICDGDPEFQCLHEFARRYGLKLSISERVPVGMVYITEERWQDAAQS